MHIFSLAFILFVLKLSAGKGFWFNLRTTDFNNYKLAIKLERTTKKYEKCKLDIGFLCKCRDTNIVPKFTELNKFANFDNRTRLKFSRKFLFEEISRKYKRLHELSLKKEQLENKQRQKYNILNDK